MDLQKDPRIGAVPCDHLAGWPVAYTHGCVYLEPERTLGEMKDKR